MYLNLEKLSAAGAATECREAAVARAGAAATLKKVLNESVNSLEGADYLQAVE